MKSPEDFKTFLREIGEEYDKFIGEQKEPEVKEPSDYQKYKDVVKEITLLIDQWISVVDNTSVRSTALVAKADAARAIKDIIQGANLTGA